MLIVDQKKTALANQIKEIIEANYQDPDFSLVKLADALYFSKSHMSRVYKGLFEEGFQEKLTALRINKARQLLEEGQGVTNVCFAVGYGDVTHFGRIFKREVGVVPSQYKSLERGENNGSQNA